MIVKENISDKLVKTYSDNNCYIKGGKPYGLYENAIDLIDGYVEYEETDIPIEEEL